MNNYTRHTAKKTHTGDLRQGQDANLLRHRSGPHHDLVLAPHVHDHVGPIIIPRAVLQVRQYLGHARLVDVRYGRRRSLSILDLAATIVVAAEKQPVQIIDARTSTEVEVDE